MIQSIAITSALVSAACAIVSLSVDSEQNYGALQVEDIAIHGSDNLLRIHVGRDPLANCYGANLYSGEDQRVAVFWYQGDLSGLLMGTGGAFHDLVEMEVGAGDYASLSFYSEKYEGLVALGAKKPHMELGLMWGAEIPVKGEGFVRVLDHEGNAIIKY